MVREKWVLKDLVKCIKEEIVLKYVKDIEKFMYLELCLFIYVR